MLQRSGDVLYEAALYRLLGELLTRTNADERAEAAFRNAIDIANRRSSKSWELRASTSLARLLAKQARRDEARAMLAEIYGWFTEGLDTADLKDAKALLNELGSKLASSIACIPDEVNAIEKRECNEAECLFLTEACHAN